MSIASRIIALREQRGWSQSDLAREAGVKQPTLNRIESGGRTPTLSSLAAIAVTLGVTIDALVQEQFRNDVVFDHDALPNVPNTYTRDSAEDPHFVGTALSDRREFWSRVIGRMPKLRELSEPNRYRFLTEPEKYEFRRLFGFDPSDVFESDIDEAATPPMIDDHLQSLQARLDAVEKNALEAAETAHDALALAQRLEVKLSRTRKSANAS